MSVLWLRYCSRLVPYLRLRRRKADTTVGAGGAASRVSKLSPPKHDWTADHILGMEVKVGKLLQQRQSSSSSSSCSAETSVPVRKGLQTRQNCSVIKKIGRKMAERNLIGDQWDELEQEQLITTERREVAKGERFWQILEVPIASRCAEKQIPLGDWCEAKSKTFGRLVRNKFRLIGRKYSPQTCFTQSTGIGLKSRFSVEEMHWGGHYWGHWAQVGQSGESFLINRSVIRSVVK